MTMELLEKNPGKALEYREAGFQMLWAAIAKNK
jgi:hypothetical protein